MDDVLARIRELRGRADAPGISIGYHGNVVTLWEALAACPDMLVDLGSDQVRAKHTLSPSYQLRICIVSCGIMSSFCRTGCLSNLNAINTELHALVYLTCVSIMGTYFLLQTSLHNPFNGGYYPVQLTFEQAQVRRRSWLSLFLC